jgi:benzoyl-CoA reductase/2-hydroxyglutaryl-CoA dehydratase subunit BcrC/BadD/HgdB
MNVGDHLRYQLNVNLLGRSALRLRRWGAEWRARSGTAWSSDVLAPPLRISACTKELIGQHYLRGNYAHLDGKVAWVTSGAPMEFLKALGFHIHYPENHAAICAAARMTVEMAGEAENAGYSQDICSYARTDIGSVLTGKTAVRVVPPPDLLLACTNICQTVLQWYRVLAEHFDVPLVLIDTPFIYTQVSEHAVSYVKRQLEEAILVAERVAGKSLDQQAFEETARLSRLASQLWRQLLERCKHQPAPISVIDQFTQMAPVVELRGEPATVDLYADMLEEVDERISQGVGAVKGERKRLLWDNLPVWYRLRWLAEFLGQHGVVVAASTYTNAWAELADLLDSSDPLETMARTYIYPILNRGAGDKLATMRRMVADYELDGVILHSDRSCKPYSVGQIDQRDRLINQYDIPALLLEADHGDPRAFSEQQVANRLSAFVEILEAV